MPIFHLLCLYFLWWIDRFLYAECIGSLGNFCKGAFISQVSFGCFIIPAKLFYLLGYLINVADILFGQVHVTNVDHAKHSQEQDKRQCLSCLFSIKTTA